MLLLKGRMLVFDSEKDVQDDFDFLTSSVTDISMNLSAGLFDIHYSFFTTVAGNIVTYLVILLQFQGEGSDRETSSELSSNTTQQ